MESTDNKSPALSTLDMIVLVLSVYVLVALIIDVFVTVPLEISQ